MKVFVLIAAANLLQSYQVLSSENICKLPSETGPCKAAFQRWFYDVKTGKCSQFVYGGCDGNKNNFETRKKCENNCESKNTAKYPCFEALQEALGPAILMHGEPRLIHKISYLPSCDMDGYFSPKQCDTTKGECWCVTKIGKEILNSRKPGKDINCDHICSLPVDVGPCFATLSKWFFNKTSERCEKFIYGGCEGNGNNFEKKKDCQDNCVSRKRRVKKALTKCQEELLDATKSKLVGRFIPRCSSDGSYSLVQCYASTGYCWCSRPDGTKYPGSDVRGKPDCDKYRSLSKEKTVNSKCQKERLEATRSHLIGRFIPSCNPDGTYQLIQCHASTAYCWCSSPDGKKHPGSEIRFKQPKCDKYRARSGRKVNTNELTKCQREALGSGQSNITLVGKFIPQCNDDGSYKLIQCHGSTGYCWCSDRNGTKFPGTDVPPGKQINCDKYREKTELTKCQQEVLRATESQLVGKFKPQCNEDGSYQLIQCHGSTGYCWCSDRDGTKFPGTDVPPGKEINCDMYREKTDPSKCQQEVLKATKSQLIGSFIPQCNEDGTYQLIQCHGSTGYCWCSDRNGVKFPGTDVPPGKEINCDKYKEKATENRVVADSNYQIMQRQKDQVSSSGDGSKTALIVVSVCAALCVMAVVGVLLARRRRRNTVNYGKIQESTFANSEEKQPLFSI